MFCGATTMAKRCLDCGKPFYSVTDRTVCQDCTGDAPDNSGLSVDQANIHAANTQPQSVTQTVDIKTLTQDGTTQTVNPRRDRKRKDKTDDAG